MILFNILFGVAIISALGLLIQDLAYLYTIKRSAAMASMPELISVLKNNTHFRQSCHTAVREFGSTLRLWLPTSVVSLVGLFAVWWYGYNNEWMLSEGMVFFATLVAIPAYARPWTHPIDISWVVAWVHGMQTVLISTVYESTKARMLELSAIPDDDITPEQFIELQHVYLKFLQLQELIGTPDELTQSEKTEL